MSEVPHWTIGSEPDLLLSHYLDFYREKAIEKVLALPEAQRATSRVPSLWTPLQLLHHLAHMEQRWFVWGFLGRTGRGAVRRRGRRGVGDPAGP